MKKMMLLLFLSAGTLLADAKPLQTLSLDSCYHWAIQNYPLIKRAVLLRQADQYSLANIQIGNYPQLTTLAQATYQSEVTRISFPGVNIEPLSKDQYRMAAEVSQVIYDGGSYSAQKKIQDASYVLATAGLQKDLYQIREKINQLFFGILLLQKQLEQNQLLITQLQETMDRVKASVQNGVAYQSDADQLAAEILLQTQKKNEIEVGIDAYRQMLGAFIGKKINSSDTLQMPVNPGITAASPNQRPELQLFQAQRSLYDNQLTLLNTRLKPRISAFVQGGYGRPGLNQLKNQFTGFYIGGVKMSWSINAFFTNKNEKSLIGIQQKETDIQKETFLFTNQLNLLQQESETQKTNRLMQTDHEIIRLKEKICAASKVKYENGVITLNDYLKEITAVNQANLNLALHAIQQIANEYNTAQTLGY